MQVIELPQTDIRPSALGFSPDGRLLAAWDDQNTLVIDPSAGTARALWRIARPRSGGGHRAPAVGFTADGTGLIAVRFTYPKDNETKVDLCVYDVATGAIKRERSAKVWNPVEIGPGGRWVYTSAHETGKFGIVRWDPITGQALPPFGSSGRDIFQLAVSADEGCVAASIWENVRVLKFRGQTAPKRATKQLPFDGQYACRALAVSADGAYFAATGVHYRGAHRVEVWVVDTEQPVTVAQGSDTCTYGRSVHFHPTRPLLVYCTGAEEVIFWDAASQTEVKRFAWGVGGVNTVRFSADGLRCAAAAAGKVVVWDVDV